MTSLAKCAVSLPTTPRYVEETIKDNLIDLTPLRAPLFPWDTSSKRTPSQYLNALQIPYGKKIAKWQQDFFKMSEIPPYRVESQIEPTRSTAPTLVALFYFDSSHTRRPLEVYLKRMKNLANMREQTIIYVPPAISAVVKALRSDQYWYVIDDYETIWDMPPNTYQYENFSQKQPKIWATFNGFDERNDWTPNPQYNHAHLSAVYNAKAFVSYDAVMRNPFGSERWMYLDAGFFDEVAPLDEQGIQWGKVIQEHMDEKKFDRAISISRDTGVVLGEYMQSEEHGALDINHQCWSDPKKAWKAHHFIGHTYVGSSLGMLNYSVRYMQTVDDLDANGRYCGREEFVMPWVMLRYPNTIFSIPWVRTPGLRIKWEYPMKSCFTTYGGSEAVPAIVDPLATIVCKSYKPRHANFAGQGLYQRTWTQRFQISFKKWIFNFGYRTQIEAWLKFFGFKDI